MPVVTAVTALDVALVNFSHQVEKDDWVNNASRALSHTIGHPVNVEFANRVIPDAPPINGAIKLLAAVAGAPDPLLAVRFRRDPKSVFVPFLASLNLVNALADCKAGSGRLAKLNSYYGATSPSLVGCIGFEQGLLRCHKPSTSAAKDSFASAEFRAPFRPSRIVQAFCFGMADYDADRFAPGLTESEFATFVFAYWDVCRLYLHNLKSETPFPPAMKSIVRAAQDVSHARFGVLL